MNYLLNVQWDANVVDLWVLDTTGNMPAALRGMAYEGKYIVTGAPAATAGVWAPGAKVYNLVDATWYINTGTTATPVWSIVPASGYVPKYVGTVTWSGSGASKAATVTGVLSTDIVIATIKTAPTQAAYLVSVAPTTDTLTFTLSAANTSNNAVISYQVLRATS